MWLFVQAVYVRAHVRVSQVGLTRRPLRNDEECGEEEDANLAARHAGASMARSRRVVSHTGLYNPIHGDNQRADYVGRCCDGPGRESVQLQQPAL